MPQTVDSCLDEFNLCLKQAAIASPPASMIARPPASMIARTPVQAPINLRAALLASAQAIQASELKITASPVPQLTTPPTVATGMASWSLAMSVKFDGSFPEQLVRIIGTGPHPGFPAIWTHPAFKNNIRVHFGGDFIDYGGNSFVPNTYYILAVTYNSANQTMTIYKNGVMAGTKTWATNPPIVNSNPSWGWNQQNYTATNIFVKDVLWFNKVLIPPEIQMLFPVADTREALLASGQALQTSELKITASPVPQMSATTPSPPPSSWTLTAGVKFEGSVPPEFIRIIGTGPHPGFPAIWAHPVFKDNIRVHFGGDFIDYGANSFVPNTYYILTVTFDGSTKVLKIYKNGVQAGTSTIANPPQVPPNSPWGWNQQNYTATNIFVKDVLWFNKALTAAEVATVASSSSGSGTSGYALEGSPFGGQIVRGRNWVLILVLLLVVIMLWIASKNM